MNRGQRDIARQLAAMEAAGLGERDPVVAAQQRRDGTASTRGPQWREWWRVVTGAVLLVGGVGLWLGAHAVTVPKPMVSSSGFLSGIDTSLRASEQRLLLEMTGVLVAVAGVVWLLNQVWPRRRTYSARAVRRAWTTAALLAATVVLWLLAGSRGGLGVSALVTLIVVTMQISYITRTTGPDTVRRPANDPRGDMDRFLTPWPVVLGVSVVFCGYQLVHLLR